MLTLGIPSNAVMALMVGAMIIQGIQPGPEVMTKKPDLFWGMIVSMWIGNPMLVIINLPMIGMWVKLLTVPYRFLAPAILLFCCIGAYSLQNSTFHVMQVAMFGVLGYIFVKLGCEGAPFLLGLVLGPQMEEYFRRAMLLSRGDPMVFIERPISLGLLITTAAAADPDGPAEYQESPRGSLPGGRADPQRENTIHAGLPTLVRSLVGASSPLRPTL